MHYVLNEDMRELNVYKEQFVRLAGMTDRKLMFALQHVAVRIFLVEVVDIAFYDEHEGVLCNVNRLFDQSNEELPWLYNGAMQYVRQSSA